MGAEVQTREATCTALKEKLYKPWYCHTSKNALASSNNCDVMWNGPVRSSFGRSRTHTEIHWSGWGTSEGTGVGGRWDVTGGEEEGAEVDWDLAKI